MLRNTGFTFFGAPVYTDDDLDPHGDPIFVNEYVVIKNMIRQDFYEIVCVCGTVIRTESTSGICPGCHRGYSISWPAVLPKKEEPKVPVKAVPPEEEQ